MMRLSGVLAALVVVAWAAEAEAQAHAKATKIDRAMVQDAITKLRSQNMDEVRDSIQFLGVSETGGAVPPLVELLRSGPPDNITDAIIDALTELNRPEAMDAYLEFVQHRRWGVRLAVLKAMEKLRDRRVPSALEDALRDSDSRVRGEAALGLGSIGARSSIEILFRAWDRGVPEAAIAIGKLGSAAHSEQLMTSLGHRPLPLILPGLREFAVRNDIPKAAKLKIIEKLLEIAGPDVKRFLQGWVAVMDFRTPQDVREAAESAIRRIPDAPPAGGAR
jgi:HEAT repeat protein